MVAIPVWLLGRGPVHDKGGERNRVLFLFFSFIFLKKFCYSNINWWERTRGHAKGEGRSETLKNKPTKENCKEIHNEPQNNVPLGKVGAGKATGRACRLKREQNGGLWWTKWGFKPKCRCLCLCVSVCVWERAGREERAERTSRKTGVHTWARRLSGNSKVIGIYYLEWASA